MRILLPFVILCTISANFAFAGNEHGNFDSELKLELQPNGKDATLLKTFVFTDKAGKKWRVPKGATVNANPLPKEIWRGAATPFKAPFSEASTLLSHLIETEAAEWKEVHRVFYNALRAKGVDDPTARKLYAGLYRYGKRWKLEFIADCKGCWPAPYYIREFTSKFDLKNWTVLADKIETENLSLTDIEKLSDRQISDEIINQLIEEKQLLRD